MKRFVVPIGIILYILALIFYTPTEKTPTLLSNTLDLYTSDFELAITTTTYSVYNESPCVDTALSIISILERHNQIGDSIQLAVSENHVQVIKFTDNEMKFLKLDSSMSITYDKSEFSGIKKLKFFSVNDFKMATTLLPPMFSINMLSTIIDNLNKPKILYAEGDYIEFER